MTSPFHSNPYRDFADYAFKCSVEDAINHDDRHLFGLADPAYDAAWPHVAELIHAHGAPRSLDPLFLSAMASPRGLEASLRAEKILAGCEAHLLRLGDPNLSAGAASHAFTELYERASQDAQAMGLGASQADAVCAKACSDACMRALMAQQQSSLDSLWALCSRDIAPLSGRACSQPAAMSRELLTGSLGSVFFHQARFASSHAPSSSSFRGFNLTGHPPGFIPAPLDAPEIAPILAYARAGFTHHANRALLHGPQTEPLAHFHERDLRIVMALGRIMAATPAQLPGAPVLGGMRRPRLIAMREGVMARLEAELLARATPAADQARSKTPSL